MSEHPTCRACGYPLEAHEHSCGRCGGSLVGLDGSPMRVGRGIAPVEFVRGFVSLFAACLTLFTRPEYAGKLKVPFLVNFVVLAIVFFGLFLGCQELISWSFDGDWGWFDWARPSPDSWFAGGLAMLLAAIVMFFLTPVLIETVMGPFLDPLAQATERIHGGNGMRPVDPGFWANAWTGLRGSAQILVVQILVLPLALVLSLTGIGAALAFILAALLNAIVWFEIPESRRGFGLTHRLQVVRRNWPAALGFGMAFQLGLLIPLFNFLILTPATAVAVSTLYLRFEKLPGAPRVRDKANLARTQDRG
ncbi:MAG: EI24 domain-containing protein [Planctomycetes bacterium]|nr:EI24 domain-containing protein [Planctomycetota bacterium]